MAKILSLILALSAATGTVFASCPKPLIIDTDFWSFDDDPLAIGLANIFETWGEAKILAIVSSVFAELVPPAIDAINTFYGHPDIPIAIQKSLNNLTQEPAYTTENGDFVTGLTYDFPEDLRSGYNTTIPLALYRRYLSEADDKSVTIVVIGEMDNVYDLLLSAPDSLSPLNGTELISAKVAEIAIQAAGIGKSYNLYAHNATFAEVVLDNWPTDVPMTFIGSNIGGNTFFGARLTTELDLDTNPVAYSFNHSVGYNTTHKTWDATAMYYAVRGLDDVYAFNFTSGEVDADANATTTWVNYGLMSGDNGVIFAADGIGNVSFAERLEDILLWEPGQTIPTNLAKIATCVQSNATTGDTNSTWTTSPVGTPTGIATAPEFTGSATKKYVTSRLAAVFVAVVGYSLLF